MEVLDSHRPQYQQLSEIDQKLTYLHLCCVMGAFYLVVIRHHVLPVNLLFDETEQKPASLGHHFVPGAFYQDWIRNLLLQVLSVPNGQELIFPEGD
jgi:hypothetical protein